MKTGRLELLSPGEIRRIHEASLDILERVGVDVLSGRVVDLLRRRGARVDGERVRFPGVMVEEAVAAVPVEIRLYDRELRDPVIVGRGETRFASGHNAVFVLDSGTGERRPARKRDIEEFARLADALEEVDLVGIEAMPQDVPPRTSLLHAFQATVTNTRKHVYFSPESAEITRGVLDMARAASGVPDLGARPPVTCQLSPTSPLILDEGAADGIVVAAEAGVPLAILPEPFTGVTCPATLAGQIALHHAEFLGGLVLAQVVRRGLSIIYGGAWTTFDMYEGNVLIASPEAAALRIAGAQMARFLGIPSHSIGPDADAHGHDEQTGWEKALTALSAIQAGTDILVNGGMFDTGLTVSLEQLVMDAEIIAIARRTIGGIEVTEETIALPVIERVGPRGSFILDPHTVANVEAGCLFQARISNRSSYGKWASQGAPDVVHRARERAHAILSRRGSPALDEARRVEVGRVLERFEAG